MGAFVLRNLSSRLPYMYKITVGASSQAEISTWENAFTLDYVLPICLDSQPTIRMYGLGLIRGKNKTILGIANVGIFGSLDRLLLVGNVFSFLGNCEIKSGHLDGHDRIRCILQEKNLCRFIFKRPWWRALRVLLAWSAKPSKSC